MVFIKTGWSLKRRSKSNFLESICLEYLRGLMNFCKKYWPIMVTKHPVKKP
ncbi:hypothetical protein LLB_0925 [Legionella longbeachae D-4968]|nr:hypothetical protein LLB_0925 [Legionella longbeachae D-4968]